MEKEITIRYLDNSEDRVTIPSFEASNIKIDGDKEAVRTNFENIMKKFPAWITSREKWIKKYQSISDSLKNNPNRDYLLRLMQIYDNPNSWLYNTAQQDICIGCTYSFEIFKALGEGFWTTGPYLFVRGYTFCAQKKIFEIKIVLECSESAR